MNKDEDETIQSVNLSLPYLRENAVTPVRTYMPWYPISWMALLNHVTFDNIVSEVLNSWREIPGFTVCL